MNYIRFRNSPSTVTFTSKDKKFVIYKDDQERVFVSEYGGFVRKAPYDNQFVFEAPKEMIGSSYLCSCGSPAVFIGSNAYSHLGSPSGMMLVCQSHTSTGKHADGSS